jgi:hypothetical protein
MKAFIGVITSGNAPTTSSATPRLSLWLGFGPGQGLPPWFTTCVVVYFMDHIYIYIYMPRILNPFKYDVPQAPKPSSSEGELLPMVSFATGSLFAHLFSFGGIMLELHGIHLGNIGVTSMGMG